MEAHLLIEKYYNAFNQADMTTFLSLLSDDVVHDINQGERQIGKQVFTKFMEKMNFHYKEQLININIMTNKQGDRAAAEFIVLGEYLQTDEGLPQAQGQKYRLPAGAFFEIGEGKITRVTNYYNLQDWIDQVSK